MPSSETPTWDQALLARAYYSDDSVVLLHGDCLDVLRTLPDKSVDSVVTDPPYGLEFMGKDWDAPWKASSVGRGARVAAERSSEMTPVGEGHSSSAGPYLAARVDSVRVAGAPFQAWCHEWATECLRVLKPGGHMIAFGGTRTWHRLVCAVEDAGFEIRDSIAWLYGCHDDQTEVLTARGWVNGLDLTDDDLVAQWSTDGTVTLARPTARQRYPFDGRMVRFRNADIDQLVTPNHRVYRQTWDRTQVGGVRTGRWSDWQVDQAADVNRWQPTRLPAAGVHDGSGIGGKDYAALLGWVWAEGGFDPSGTGVRVYQSSVNQPFVDEIAALLDRLGPHKRYDYPRTWKGRTYTSTTWYVSGDLATRVRADLPGKAPTWDLLWRMTAAEKRALWGAAMKGDGSKAARTFWQKDRAALEWAQALLACINSRGKIADDPRGAMHWQPSATVELQRRHLSDDGEDYTGEVWCVTVPSGAFIVRRNGRVSVSGNSGFPKSLDVSKAIDKAAGATREVVGYRGWMSPRMAAGMGVSGLRQSGSFAGEYEGERVATPVTAPATPAAEQWQGWGTALKPAHEPIVVARKPLAGTVAANVLTHGTGALNIDDCRIGDDTSRADRYNGKAAHGQSDGYRMHGRTEPFTAKAGRWPANVVLDEHQAEALDEQSGESASPPVGSVARTQGGNTIGTFAHEGRDPSPNGHGDIGGASRFFYTAKAGSDERPTHGGTSHPTVKPLALMRWLVRLVTPPGGTVLEPFAGSGTTAEACLLERFHCIAIEREADYLPLILQRINRRRDPIAYLTNAGHDLGLFGNEATA